LSRALDGYNVCLFAYGQTGSGKTHTMLGNYGTDGADLGLIPRSVELIFNHAEKLKETDWHFELEASFVEIYNETIRDLLSDSPSKDKVHEIKMDKGGKSTFITNVTTESVETPAKIHQLIQKSMKNRSTAATNCNEQSSRSHSVFRLKIRGTNAESGAHLSGILNLIDLAGSERLDKSGVQGARLLETQHINKSLSALGDVIAALARRKTAGHVPYRNSKLTYMLMDSLGGDSKTLMFVNLSPMEESLGESVSSLRFASKVNSVEIGTARRSQRIDLSSF